MKKKLIIVITSTIILITLSYLAISNNIVDNSLNKTVTNTLPKSEFVAKDDNLTFSFMQLENNETNMIYSPLSIKYALSMLREGANGKTKEELDAVLGNISLNGYENIENVLSIANSVFIKDDYKKYVAPEYINRLNSVYGAEIYTDSFSNSQRINNWISDKTYHEINNLIKDSDIDSDTVMFLINAVAMNMKWENKFDVNEEKDETFYYKDGNTGTVNTLINTFYNENISFSDNDDLQSITMPYKKYEDTQLEFIAIMPKTKTLQDFIKDSNLESIDDIINNQCNLKDDNDSNHSLELHIPAFKYEYELNIVDDLKALGVNDVFTMNADLSKILKSKVPELYVSDIKHKAKIELNSEGTKAVAVTTIELTLKNCAMKEDLILNFNKPFLYIIRDTATKDIFFMGTLYEPQ